MKDIGLKKKVGQLLVIGFDGKTVPDEVKELIKNYHIGGIILFARNIGTPKELLTLTTELQKEAKDAGYKHPLLICVDQENGVVRRLGEGTSILPGAMALGATQDSKYAYEVGRVTGKELKALGINWNLSPVLDVNNNPNNPVIGVRSFGDSPEKVAEFGRSLMKGMQDAGIVTTLKHFPGHGDTNSDSHLDLPVISHRMERLEEIELKPFKECIKSGADMIMSAHVYFPTIEDEPGVPATLSKKVITHLLRENMGFDGLVTTDCMEMKAISESIGTEKGAVAALKAGVDLVMISHSYDRQTGAIKEILSSIQRDEIDVKHLEQSIQRINHIKEKYLNWDDTIVDKNPEVSNIVGSETHEKMANDIYRKSVTVIRNDGILPLASESEARILVINPANSHLLGVEDKDYKKTSLGEAVKKYDPNADVYQISSTLNDREIEEVVDQASLYDIVIIGTLSVTERSHQIDLIEQMLNKKIPIIAIGMRNPYDILHLPNISAYINTYEFSYPALKIAAGAIFGEETVSGKTPVKLNGK